MSAPWDSSPTLIAEIERPKAINAELLAALQKLLNFPNAKHFNGEGYAEEHGALIGECRAAITNATKEKTA